jgi:DNA-binding transcriptional MocR family regulator
MDITKILSGIRLSSTPSVPLYLQIATALTSKIKDFTLTSGTKLPPERELARLLSVSRTTAINAYSLLEERGLVSTRVGSGTFVSNDSPSPSVQSPAMPWEQLFTPGYKSPLSSIMRSIIASPTADDTISMAAGMPDPNFYPLEMIQSLLNDRHQQFDPADLGLIATEGYLPLRRSLSAWQSRLGKTASPDQILIVSGSQQGLYLVVKSFIEARDYVIVESPTYLGAIQLLESSGARLLCLPPSGKLDLEIFEDHLIRYRPKLFYTISDFQNPTGRVRSLSERQELIRLAARHRLTIIEDDPYSLLHYGAPPPPSLKQLDAYGGVIHLGTFSKTLFPGLRTGWVHAAPQVINRLAQEKQYVDLHSHNLAQMIINRCLEEDTLSSHLIHVRREYKKRRNAMAAAIRKYCGPSMEFDLAEGGLYIWGRMGPMISPTELLRHAATMGISFVPGDAFYAHGTPSHEIRLCFATHDEERLTEGIRRLSRALSTVAATSAAPAVAAGRPII